MNLKIKSIVSQLNWISYNIPLYQLSRRCGQTALPIAESTLVSILKERFPKAKDIQVKDTSGGCGQMFSVLVESEDFKNLSVLKQHKLVYETLNDQIKSMHGLHLVTKAS